MPRKSRQCPGSDASHPIEECCRHVRNTRCLTPAASGRSRSHRRARGRDDRGPVRVRRDRADAPPPSRAEVDDRRAVRGPQNRPRRRDRPGQPWRRHGRGLGGRARLHRDRRLRRPRRPRATHRRPAGEQGRAPPRRVRRISRLLHPDAPARRHRPGVCRHALGVPPRARQSRAAERQARHGGTPRRHRSAPAVGPGRCLRAHPKAPAPRRELQLRPQRTGHAEDGARGRVRRHHQRPWRLPPRPA